MVDARLFQGARNLGATERPSDRRQSRRALSGGTALGGAALALLLIAPVPARAANECGTPTDGAVTCTPTGNPYAGGINYNATDDLTVNLASGVAVDTSGSSYTPGVGIYSYENAIAVNTASDATITTDGTRSTGVRAGSYYGSITVGAQGDITTHGFASDGVDAIGYYSTIGVTVGNVTTTGGNSAGVRAVNTFGEDYYDRRTAVGAAVTPADAPADPYASSVTVNGTISTSGPYSPGVYARNDLGSQAVVVNGAIGTLGEDSDGIFASGDSGVTISGAGTVSTAGDYSIGIDANGENGAASVTIGSVTTTGYKSPGIYVQASGDIGVNVGAVSTQGDYSDGISAAADADGVISVTSTGTISTSGDHSLGVYAVSNGTGTIAVTADNITTTGDYSTGIVAINKADDPSGAVSVTVNGAISTSGSESYGVYARNDYGSVSVENDGSVKTTGDGAVGIYAGADAGVTVTGRGSVTTTGYGAKGIYAGSYGDVSVTTGAVSTEGGKSTGIYAFSYAGGVTVDATSVATVGNYSTGIYAGTGEDSAGAISVTAGTVSTQGVSSDGIQAISHSGGDVTVISTGSVSTVGDNSVGIDVAGSGGAVNVSAVDVSTMGDNSDAIRVINALSGGEDTVTADALPVATAPDVAVTVTGTVSTAGVQSIGVYAVNRAGGAVSIENDGAIGTTGYESDGIVAVSPTGDVTISGAGSIATAGDYSDGVFALSYAGGNVSVTTGGVSTQGLYSTGIDAIAVDGNATVTAGTVSTKGDTSDGIYALTDSGGDVTVTTTGSVSTAGASSIGIDAIGSGGAVNVSAVDVSTIGNDSDAIHAINSAGEDVAPAALAPAAAPDVAVTVTGTISTKGADSIGIYAYNPVGAVSVENDGAVSTAGVGSTGIVAVSESGDVTVSGTGSVTTTGDYAAGIYAGGAASVSVTNGTVSTAGAYSDGVDAYSYGGTVTVNTGTVAVTGTGSDGIYATGTGDVSVTAGATSAKDGVAIVATSTGGATTVDVSGATKSLSGDAIEANGATGATVNVAATGSVTGATNAIVIAGGAAPADGGPVEQQAVRLAVAAPRALAVVAPPGGTAVNNAGTITGGSGYAILASGGPTAIDNSGTINGRVSLTANDDSFANSGTFSTTGTSDFGAGTDSFVNSGTVKASGVTTFANLEGFTNAGTITLANGVIGDKLEIGGNYFGANGTLALDANFSGATPTGDLLVIDGDASGTTQVVVNGTASPTLDTRLVIVDVAGASPANAFTVASRSQNSGFAFYAIQYDPTLTNYYLTAVAGPGVFRGLKMNEGAQSLWYKTADVWSAHMLDIGEVMRGNAPAPAGRVWGQLYGSVSKRADGRVYTSGGITQNIDLSYRQDYYGGQIGVDLGSTGDSGGFVFGVTGGYLSSALTFNGVADKVDYDDYNAGVYAGFTGGAFFVNGLAKYDYYQIDAQSASVGYRDKFHGRTYGAMGETGFRFGGDSFHFEPVASIAYTRTDLNDLQALGSTIDFDKLDGLRGKAGLRIGGSAPIAHGSTITYYAGGNVVKEFKGRDGLVFTSGLSTVPLRNDRIGTYGEFRAGVNIASANGVTGFIEGDTDYSKDYKGYGGRVGIRVKF